MVADSAAGTALCFRRFLSRLVFALALCALFLSAFPAAAQTGNEWQASAWQLWQINVDGSELKQLTDIPGRRCGSPVWSPDGNFIVFDVNRSDQAWNETQIAVINADGTHFHTIGPGNVPSWSPDGRLIACHAVDPPFGIVIMNPDGKGREVVLQRGWSVRWSPRGDRLATLAADGNEIVALDVPTGRDRRIFTSHYPLRHGFSISPDGNRFCFGSDVHAGLALAAFDDGWTQSTVRWLVETGTAYHSSWSPDGGHVVFAWRRTPQDTIQLYTLDVDAGSEPKLLPGIDRDRSNVNPAWSRDGKTIVFSRPEPL
jgi:Tol biopolymer transport system component